LIRRLNISILCLVETKVRNENMDRVVSAMVLGWEVLHNYGAHCYGRIWVCWDPSIASLTVVDVHEQVLTFKVCPSSSKDPWLFSAVYGANQGPNRHRLLQNLEVIKRCYGC
jgi:hypothetical protein